MRIFWILKKRTFKKFSAYFWFVIVVKTIDAPMLFWSVFFKMHEKKVLILGAFSKIPNKITIVCLLFLKLNQSRNTKKKFFLCVFLQKPKTCFFGGKNKILLKLKFQICISAFVLYFKRKLHTNFQKNLLIFKSPGIFWKWKLWRESAGTRSARVETSDLDF